MAKAASMQLSRKNEYRRPTINFDIDRNPYNVGCPILISVMEAFGHPTVYIELTPQEAEDFATVLLAFVHPAKTFVKAVEEA